jgi:hypothetical protein
MVAVLRPTPFTDAYEDDTPWNPPVVFLAGPIKHWWTCWESPEHMAYVQWRDKVQGTLIEAGYLTYCPWGGIKGTWNPKAQAINDAAIAVADVVLILTPHGIPADGTEDESQYAKRVRTPTLRLPPGSDILQEVRRLVGFGTQWD